MNIRRVGICRMSTFVPRSRLLDLVPTVSQPGYPARSAGGLTALPRSLPYLPWLMVLVWFTGGHERRGGRVRIVDTERLICHFELRVSVLSESRPSLVDRGELNHDESLGHLGPAPPDATAVWPARMVTGHRSPVASTCHLRNPTPNSVLPTLHFLFATGSHEL